MLFLTFKIIGQLPTFLINGYIIVDTRHKWAQTLKSKIQITNENSIITYDVSNL